MEIIYSCWRNILNLCRINKLLSLVNDCHSLAENHIRRGSPSASWIGGSEHRQWYYVGVAGFYYSSERSVYGDSGFSGLLWGSHPAGFLWRWKAAPRSGFTGRVPGFKWGVGCGDRRDKKLIEVIQKMDFGSISPKRTRIKAGPSFKSRCGGTPVCRGL